MTAPLVVLVTGASGLIGAELCTSLAARGHAVLAMVHRRTTLVSCDGMVEARIPGGPPAPGTVTLMHGDIGRPDLGCADPEAMLADCDRIVHCAADTRFSGTGLEAINVGGTRHLVEALARSERPPGLIHVSTAYVCGERSGPIPEAPTHRPGGNGYEESKRRAEGIATGSGIPVAIARPSIVVGRWHDGAIARFEGLYTLLKFAAEGRIGTLPAAPGATLDLVPIDHVVGGLVDLVEGFERARGGIFHLASGRPVPIDALCRLDVEGLRNPRIAPSDAPHPLLDVYASYLGRDPRFATDGIRCLSGRVCPSTDEAFLRRMIGYAVASGFLRRVSLSLDEPVT